MNNTTNKRIMHTKLYSKIANEIIMSVAAQLSDGIWENSPVMEKYWRFMDITTAPDGEVLIKISPESGNYNKYTGRWYTNGFFCMTDDAIINWFAAKLKQIMQTELKDNEIENGWKRTNNEFKTEYLCYYETISVRDVYFIYDYLMGRDVERNFQDIILRVVGIPASAKVVAAEEARRANLDKLEAEWIDAKQKLDDEKQMKIKLIEEEFSKKLEACNAKYKKLYDEAV